MNITQLFAKHLSNYDNQNSLGSKFRLKRIAPLLEIIESVYQQHGAVNMIDVGGTRQYWHILQPEYFEHYNITVTLVNFPGTVTLKDESRFVFVETDGCDLGHFADNAFHIGHSNSVVEHVGDWERMIKFANEISRVSQRFFVQTPSYWFPIEPHCMTPFFHWLPKPIRVGLVLHFQLGHFQKASTVSEAVSTVESARLLDKKMFQALFQQADILTERFFFWPKSFVAIKK